MGSVLGAWLSSQSPRRRGDPAGAEGRLGGGLLVLSPERPERGLEEGLVDPTLEDRHVHLDALGEHISTLHVHLVRELGGRQVNGHLGHSLTCERRLGMYIASGRRVNSFSGMSGDF